MNTLNHCPICNATQFKEIRHCIDYTVSHEQFQIVACESCGFHFTNPIPEIEKLGAYYESEDYISHSNTSEGLVNKVYQIVRNYTIGQKVKLIRKYSSENRLLDIGCGTGEFLRYCESKNYKTTGIEPADSARNFAKQQYKLDVFEETKLKSFEKESFDIITMWHVMEHVYYLKDRVEEIGSLLKPGGIAIVAVPNCSSYDAEHYAQFWAAYDLPRHLYHFKPENMLSLFASASFESKGIHPMPFDSFYVSMLSEKYKTGSSNLFSAFWIGLKSNFLAWRKKNNSYSSQIYVFQKN